MTRRAGSSASRSPSSAGSSASWWAAGITPNTQIRLVVDGKVVRATSGKDNEQLQPATWEVAAFQGQTAHIEIVDEQQGRLGAYQCGSDRVLRYAGEPGADAGAGGVAAGAVQRRFAQRATRAGARRRSSLTTWFCSPGRRESSASNGTHLLTRAVGKGKVVIAAGPVLEPAQAGFSHQRQPAYAFVCGLVGAKYTGSGGLQHPKAPGLRHAGFGGAGARDHRPAGGRNIGMRRGRRLPRKAASLPLAQAQSSPPTPLGQTVYGAVAATVTVPAGKSVEVPFLLTWHYPNKYNAAPHLDGLPLRHPLARRPGGPARGGDAASPQMRERTERFRQTFYDSTLPYWLLDCVTANAAILRHIGVVFRIANGDIYGWEGSNGCCDPTCTHVWGYEQSLARLFPDLERDMRRIDFTHQQRAGRRRQQPHRRALAAAPDRRAPLRRRPCELHSQGLPRGAQPAGRGVLQGNTGRTSNARSNT